MKPYYSHAGIEIYHGDCRDVLPVIGNVHTVITDPPYGINFAGQPTKWQRLAGQQPETWDAEPVDLSLVLQAGTELCIWGGNYYSLPASRGWLVWVKPDAPPSMATLEMAWTNQDRNSRHIIHSISATNAERLGHPTQKPLTVMRWCVSQFEGHTVLDPFMGSGTTLRAAKDLGRRAIGIEISEEYCRIAVKRLEQEALPLGFEEVEQRESFTQPTMLDGMTLVTNSNEVGREMRTLNRHKVTNRK